MRLTDWRIVRRAGTRKDGFHGLCCYDSGTIVLGAHLRGKAELDTLIHELIHAAHPEKAEHVVASEATELTEILWRYGYRRSERGKKP